MSNNAFEFQVRSIPTTELATIPLVEKIAGTYATGGLLGTARAARAEPAESRSSGGGGSRPLHRGEERRRSKKESDVEKVRVSLVGA